MDGVATALPVTPPAEVALADVAPLLDRAELDTFIEEIELDGVRATLDVFLEETAERLALMRRLVCVEADRAKIETEAHTLKGSSSTFGLTQLSTLGRTLEHTAHQIAPEDYRDLLDRIEATFAASRDAVEPAMSEHVAYQTAMNCAAPAPHRLGSMPRAAGRRASAAARARSGPPPRPGPAHRAGRPHRGAAARRRRPGSASAAGRAGRPAAAARSCGPHMHATRRRRSSVGGRLRNVQQVDPGREQHQGGGRKVAFSCGERRHQSEPRAGGIAREHDRPGLGQRP